MTWAESFILSYDDPRYFTRVRASGVQNLFVDWLIEQFGDRDFRRSPRSNRWELYGTEVNEPHGVKVVFKRSEDAMLFKLAWL